MCLLNISAGNVRETSFIEIWRDAEIFKNCALKNIAVVVVYAIIRKSAVVAEPGPIITIMITWLRSHGVYIMGERVTEQ